MLGSINVGLISLVTAILAEGTCTLKHFFDFFFPLRVSGLLKRDAFIFYLMCVPCVCSARRGDQILWNWSCRWLWVAMWAEWPSTTATMLLVTEPSLLQTQALRSSIKVVTHLEQIFAQDERCGPSVILLHVGIYLPQHHLSKRLSLKKQTKTSCVYFCHCSQKQSGYIWLGLYLDFLFCH